MENYFIEGLTGSSRDRRSLVLAPAGSRLGHVGFPSRKNMLWGPWKGLISGYVYVN